MLVQRKTKVRVLRAGQRYQVWLYQIGRKRKLAGSIDARLAVDAGRRGQDLINELVEKSLREADRRMMAAAGD